MSKVLYDLVWRKADSTCEYCQMPQRYDALTFEVDHIFSQKVGGLTQLDNLALACFSCNKRKGPNIAGLDPGGQSDEIVPLFHPRQQAWNDHFKWDGAVLKGLTSTGRVTIEMLGINLPSRVSLREALIIEGVFSTD